MKEYIQILKGTKIGRWIVIGYKEKKIKKAYYVKCKCKCGTIKWIQKGTLKDGTSTGCYKCQRRVGFYRSIRSRL